MNKNCKTCCWAQWQRTKKGNIITTIGGDCTYVNHVFIVPECDRVHVSRSAIWMYYGQNCPCWNDGIPKQNS
jgi:hypothetical protein